MTTNKQLGILKKIGAELNDFERHLGKDFEVILQSCSTAGEGNGNGKNIAEAMSEGHKTEVSASNVSIHALTIASDGRVTFKTNAGDGSPIVFSN